MNLFDAKLKVRFFSLISLFLRLSHPSFRASLLISSTLNLFFFVLSISDGLFGNTWGQQMEVAEKSGCNILLSGSHITVMPKPGPKPCSIAKAIDIIEDALVGSIGAQESKCRLIYELTESYSEVWLDGVLSMRDPLNSCQRIWASIIDLPMYKNEEGEEKPLLPPFTSKETEIELHKLKCNVKVCTDCFDIKLDHCSPYAMIMGRQKSNVGKAIDFVKKSVKEHRKKFGM